MRCDMCEEEITEDGVRWYGDDPYCEHCFFESYTYCCNCDEAVDRDYCRYDSNDDPVCDYCYGEDSDPDAPDDPDVFDSNRTEIISLANNWLTGERPKRLIKINHHDYRLQEIQEGLGLVDLGLYLYGLQDREEYQLKVSPNLFNRVSQYTTLNNWNIKIEMDIEDSFKWIGFEFILFEGCQYCFTIYLCITFYFSGENFFVIIYLSVMYYCQSVFCK